MLQVKTHQGINVKAITFDEHGEIMVLDTELLELVSGGAAKPPSGPTPTPTINVACGNTINFSCSPTPPGPKPPKAGDEYF